MISTIAESHVEEAALAWLDQLGYKTANGIDIGPDGQTVARQSGWKHSDNQDGNFGGRGGRMIVAARR